MQVAKSNIPNPKTSQFPPSDSLSYETLEPAITCLTGTISSSAIKGFSLEEKA